MLQTPGNDAGIAGVKRPHEEAGGDKEDEDYSSSLDSKRVKLEHKKSTGMPRLLKTRIYLHEVYSGGGWEFESPEEEREFHERMDKESNGLQDSWEREAKTFARHCFSIEKKIYDEIVSKRTGGDEVV